MDAYLNSADVKIDFDRLKLASVLIEGAAKTTLDFSSTVGQVYAANSLAQAKLFLNQWL